MPDSITVANVQQYKANVELLLQQKESRLRNAVTVGAYVGKAASIVEQFGSATAVLKVSRNSDTPLLDLAQDKRWVFPNDYEWASLIDQQDKLRMIIDPTSPYAMAAAAAMNRAMDDVIITAFFASAFKGENGTTTDAFDTSGSQVDDNIGGADSGLNVAKLQLVIRKLIGFYKGEIEEPVYGLLASNEHDNLLHEVQVTNADFGGSAVLQDGRVRRFMGIDFILSERIQLLAGSTTDRTVPFWTKSGMHLGIWQDIIAKVSERADKSYATQVYTAMTLGATRTQTGKVIQVLCDNTN